MNQKQFVRKSKEDKPVLAICYDFDKTLSPDDMQAQGYIQSVGYDIADFWKESDQLAKNNEMDQNLAYMYKMIQEAEGTRDQIANSHWIIEKPREFQKNIYFCFIDYTKAFDCIDHNKLWKILREMGIPDHLTCLLRNLHTGQEATVRTGHGTTDWFQIG